MKAIDAKKISDEKQITAIYSEFYNILSVVKRAAEEGKYKVRCYIDFDEDNIKSLKDLGYNVYRINKNKNNYFYEVSWEHLKK